jgi:hypothetical protein
MQSFWAPTVHLLVYFRKHIDEGRLERGLVANESQVNTATLVLHFYACSPER